MVPHGYQQGAGHQLRVADRVLVVHMTEEEEEDKEEEESQHDHDDDDD